MNCLECQDLLSDYLDELLPSSKQSAVKIHLNNCRTCQEVQLDLEKIVNFGGTLLPSANLATKPPQNMLTSNRLPFSAASFWQKRVQLSFSFTQVMVLVLVVGGLWFYQSSKTDPSVAATVNTESNVSLVDINAQEAQILSATKRLTHTIKQRRASWDPELQQLFDRNLAIVETYIIECQRFVTKNPKDSVAREMLLNAYQEKLRLFEQFEKL
jgi:Putative zinc-finger